MGGVEGKEGKEIEQERKQDLWEFKKEGKGREWRRKHKRARPSAQRKIERDTVEVEKWANRIENDADWLHGEKREEGQEMVVVVGKWRWGG